MQYLGKLLASHDFVLLQETHSTIGGEKAFRPPQGTRGWWSHESHSTGGVGIMLQERFLEQFNPVQPSAWIQVVPGRVAVLRLDGPNGSLDIYCVYFHTGANIHGRSHLRARLAASIRPAATTLSLIAGDFNYVTCHDDRFAAPTCSWSGRHDMDEEQAWKSLVADPWGLHELEQNNFTHSSALGQSRLDRVYSNHHLADQLDRHVCCAALEWVPDLSAHRAVTFSRSIPESKAGSVRSISPAVVERPDWTLRVSLRLRELESASEEFRSDLGRLQATKQAIREVSETIAREVQAEDGANTSDKLGTTMRFLRAMEREQMGTMRRCALEYPFLATLADPQNPIARSTTALGQVKAHAVALARQGVLDDLRHHSTSAADPAVDEATRAARRGNILNRLRRLAPGKSTSISAVRDASGVVQHEAGKIAEALTSHWKQVFASKPIDEVALQSWLDSVLPQDAQPHLGDFSNWRIRRSDVRQAIGMAGSSRPGPDGIPFLAWQQLGRLGVDVLYGAASRLTSPNAVEELHRLAGHNEDGHDFNLSLLCCLPKKTSGWTDGGVAFCDASDTRPLSIVNTDNRLIANAYRLRWEPTLEQRICPEQRGFLPGRSMLENVLDIEHGAMVSSLRAENSALVLFDFAAAFPSVSHAFLFRVLKHVGIPREALQVIQAFYDNNRCYLSFRGGQHKGFEMKSGIRQGCPLSPLLFATVADALLVALQQLKPGSLVRAFADDTAMVVHDWWGHANEIFALFDHFATVSGLRLNLPKTVVIPLWEQDVQEIQAELQRRLPERSGVSFCAWGRYLGFATGPQKDVHSWDKAVAKFLESFQGWSWNTLGLQYAAAAYNTYLISLLLFVGQLERPAPAALNAESAMLRRVAVGPGNWCTPEDLWHLRECYGMPTSFRSLQVSTLAGQVRVATWEAKSTGGLRHEQKVRELDAAMKNTVFLHRLALWAAWYQNAHARVLGDAVRKAQSIGIRVPSVIEVLSGGAPRPWTKWTFQKVVKGFQKEVAQQILDRSGYNSENRIRAKLGRWHLAGPERHLACRALAGFRGLTELVPPRVVAAVFSTVWNRWPTARRMQLREGNCNYCQLGCGGQAEDSIEHYSRCKVLRTFASRRLNYHPPEGHFLPQWCMVDSKQEQRAMAAITAYVAYRATNIARQEGGINEARAYELLGQLAHDAVRGHRAAADMVESAFVRRPRLIR